MYDAYFLLFSIKNVLHSMILNSKIYSVYEWDCFNKTTDRCNMCVDVVLQYNLWEINHLCRGKGAMQYICFKINQHHYVYETVQCILWQAVISLRCWWDCWIYCVTVKTCQIFKCHCMHRIFVLHLSLGRMYLTKFYIDLYDNKWNANKVGLMYWNIPINQCIWVQGEMMLIHVHLQVRY